VDSDMGVVKAAHREQLIPVLTRILYAKLVQRKVGGGGTSLATDSVMRTRLAGAQGEGGNYDGGVSTV
jgi:hypothetical protein